MASGGADICVSSTSFQKNNIGWPQQPLTEKVLISMKNLIFDDTFYKKGPVLVISVPGMNNHQDQYFFDEMRLLRSLRPPRLLRLQRSLRLLRF